MNFAERILDNVNSSLEGAYKKKNRPMVPVVYRKNWTKFTKLPHLRHDRERMNRWIKYVKRDSEIILAFHEVGTDKFHLILDNYATLVTGKGNKYGNDVILTLVPPRRGGLLSNDSAILWGFPIAEIK